MDINLIIGELPADLQQAFSGGYQNVMTGIGVQDITPEIAKKLRIPDRIKGVIVNNIQEDSPAEGVLMRGDVIQEINRKRISNIEDYQEVVAGIKGEEDVLLLVYRGGASLFLTLTK
jgi:serine protease Do